MSTKKKFKKGIRVNVTFSPDEFKAVEKIADLKEWSFSKAGRYYLIEQGRREERKGVKP